MRLTLLGLALAICSACGDAPCDQSVVSGTYNVTYTPASSTSTTCDSGALSEATRIRFTQTLTSLQPDIASVCQAETTQAFDTNTCSSGTKIDCFSSAPSVSSYLYTRESITLNIDDRDNGTRLTGSSHLILYNTDGTTYCEGDYSVTYVR